MRCNVGRFAENTTVSVEKSQQEIRTLLTRYGANQFATGDDTESGMSFVQFKANDRNVRFVLTLPQRSEKRFWMTARNVRRTEAAAYEQWEQACRTKWRALTLCIKAKLEAVASGISEFEEEFLAHIVLPGGGTVSQLVRPQIAEAYLSGSVPDGIHGLLGHTPTTR